jgi:hypothetical protein
MNDESINRAIAEHLGWKFIPCHDDGFGKATGERWLDPDGDIGMTPPDYCGDLNAMHEAVQSLNEVELFRYADEVCDLAYDGHHDTDIQKMLKLSAEELAECFVRAIGKWRGEE